MSDSSSGIANQGELFGHPCGLFTLFFAEMWERFSYYGMRALLTLYMLKGFLKYDDKASIAVYGTYTALVYMTPFFGGMLADLYLGRRIAVILGGIFMAVGHGVMGIQNETAFFVALAFLIVGNGFFKPNISTIVGSLYGDGDKRRDNGFTIFYIGINLGAALAPLVCGYVGEKYGWHNGFNLATLGMLIGLAVFWAPTKVAQMLILAGAFSTSCAMIWFQKDAGTLMLSIYSFMALALLGSAILAFVALGRGGIPESAGLPPNPERLKKPLWGGMSQQNCIIVGSLVAVPILTLLVSASRQIKLLSDDFLKGLADGGVGGKIASNFLGEISTPGGMILLLAGVGALVYLIKEGRKLNPIPRDRMRVVLILMFFSLLFWALFEQAGTSINLFTDRNVDRAQYEETVSSDQVGQTVRFRIPQAVTKSMENSDELKKMPMLSQAQFGQRFGNPANQKRISELALSLARKSSEDKGELDDKKEKELSKYAAQILGMDILTSTGLDALRTKAGEKDAPFSDLVFDWTIHPDNVGMGLANNELATSVFQSANPMFILIFGLVFTALWGFLAARKLEPNIPVKFALGLIQLGLGFGALWYGANSADDRGMVAVVWLLLGYLLHTTGELCISPVGLSMVTKLSPAKLVSTVMGAWFLATACSNFLAGVIAQFTSVGHGSGGKEAIPGPLETVMVYGGVYGQIALAGIISGVFCIVLSPWLKRWMHEGEPNED